MWLVNSDLPLIPWFSKCLPLRHMMYIKRRYCLCTTYYVLYITYVQVKSYVEGAGKRYFKQMDILLPNLPDNLKSVFQAESWKLFPLFWSMTWSISLYWLIQKTFLKIRCITEISLENELLDKKNCRSNVFMRSVYIYNILAFVNTFNFRSKLPGRRVNGIVKFVSNIHFM